MNSSTKFQATLAMIQTVPQVADSASQLHDNVMLCQLIAGARFGEEAAQDPDIVFRLLAHLEEGMAAYADNPVEYGGPAEHYEDPYPTETPTDEIFDGPSLGGRVAGAPAAMMTDDEDPGASVAPGLAQNPA